ncbi:lipocalin family protein [Flavobacterium sp. RHBU_3]|uniref:lipocalin family protein n=1 Tax=Flavobacterium sp. RHBU_3 TaxID=3391184 RepID=UPI003984AB2B
MKKLILATILAALFVSCSKEESVSSVEIEGVWTLKSLYGLTRYDLNNDGVESSNLLQEYYGCGADNTLTFSEDGTVLFHRQKLVSTINCSEVDFEGTWTKKGNNLTLVFPDETSVYKINPSDQTISIQITPYGYTSLGAVTAIFIYKKQE